MDRLRHQITQAISHALQPMACVLAVWKGGSAAFNTEDAYSDIDLNVLLDDASPEEPVYAAVQSALGAISPVVATHPQPPGRYFKLQDGGDHLLVDVCLYRPQNLPECLNTARHGAILPLFDKGQWLQTPPSTQAAQDAARTQRLRQHQQWFSISQTFVRKAIARGRHIEALASFWGYTLKPLVELLRMQHCPARWDFGMRYLDRDLPAPVYAKLQDLIFVQDPQNLPQHHAQAIQWAEQLLQDLDDGTKLALKNN